MSVNRGYELEELFDYKNQMIGDFLENKEIVRLLTDDAKPIKNPESLVYKQILPYEYVPDTVEHGQTFICCEVDIKNIIDKTYMSPVIYVWEFTHKSKLRLPQGGLRIDMLASEIAKTLNGSRFYGLGELNLYSVRCFSPVAGYQGRELVFFTKDFNRVGVNQKPIPFNRKGN